MAINKVDFGNTTIMDITDTTAEEKDVVKGKVFYKNNGERSTGTSNYAEVFYVYFQQTTAQEIIAAVEANKILFYKTTTSDNRPFVVVEYTKIDDNKVSISIANTSDGFIRYSITGSNWVVTAYNFIKDTQKATDSVLGLLKTNAAENISLDSDGKLVVGGRLGQFAGTTGIFSSNDREPRNVGDSSFLITDAKGMNLNTNRAFALVSGLGITCKSAAAGATEYRVANNYANRIVCKMVEGGYASRDEATSKIEQIVSIVSVTINGSSFTPSSAADSSTDDIVIKTSETLNPNSAITSIRLFGIMGSYSSVYTGNGIKGESGGRNLLIGGGVTKASSSNDNCLVGNGIYSSANGVAAFGRYHIARKNRGFLAGTGHDTTNAPSEGASAVGQYSFMDSNTLFAVGNGSSHTARRNAFEVRSDGIVLRSPNGTRYKLSIDDSGNLITTAL